MRRSLVVFAGLLAAALSASACDNGPTSAPTPTPGPTVTETFTGTITLNGSITHPFNVTAGGAVVATVTAVTPTDAVVGFQLGTWNTVTCSAVLSNDLASSTSVLSGSTATTASLCVRMHDPNGIVTNPVTYTVTVVHP